MEKKLLLEIILRCFYELYFSVSYMQLFLVPESDRLKDTQFFSLPFLQLWIFGLTWGFIADMMQKIMEIDRYWNWYEVCIEYTDNFSVGDYYTQIE